MLAIQSLSIYALYLHLMLQSGTEIGQRIYPVVLKENLLLNSYNISKSYKLSDREYLLIGRPKSESIENEGHRLIYLQLDSVTNKFVKKYESMRKGEAYVYNSYFFKINSDEVIIIAEEGYEYMSGIDIFRLSHANISYFGYIPVSGGERDPIIEKIKIEKMGNEYTFSFKGDIEYEIGTDNIIDGSKLTASYRNNELKINLK